MTGVEENPAKLWQDIFEHRLRTQRAESPQGEIVETPEFLAESGRFWKAVRDRNGLSRGDVLLREPAIDRDELIMLENGIKSPLDLSPDFLPRLAVALGNPAYFDTYYELYGYKLFPNTQDSGAPS